MNMPRAIGLVLIAVGVCAYGTAPDWLALSVGLTGLAVNRHGIGTPDRLAIGTPLRARREARAWSARSRRRSGELARKAEL